MIGAFLGPDLAILAISQGRFLRGVFAAILMASGLRGRKDPIPFGLFLACGGLVLFVRGGVYSVIGGSLS